MRSLSIDLRACHDFSVPRMAMAMANSTDYHYTPSPSRLPKDDLGPSMRVAVWILVSAATVFLTLRLYCKYLRHRRLHLDDWFLIAAWVCSDARRENRNCKLTRRLFW